jgi:hypothetical protein
MKPLLLGKSLSQTREPMSESLVDLPEVEPRDPEPVAVAIETARALFRTGERLDALRWLRRAAERAEEAGDDVRSVSLARCAADLSTELQSVPPPPTRTSVPPPPPPPTPPPALEPVSAPPPTSRRHDEAIALSPYDDFTDKTAVDGPTAAVRDALQSGVHITELPDSQSAPHSVTMPSPSSSIPVVAPSPITPAVVLAKPVARQALRVAVSPDPRSPGAWLARPLSEGVPAPPGSEEALLVALDPNSRLLDD